MSSPVELSTATTSKNFSTFYLSDVLQCSNCPVEEVTVCRGRWWWWWWWWWRRRWRRQLLWKVAALLPKSTASCPRKHIFLRQIRLRPLS